MDENKIIIKQSYFTNIQTAINCINEFFSSQFKNKNFPVLDEGMDLDPTVERIISRLNAVDSSWVFDENKFQDMMNLINGEIDKIDPENGVYGTIMDSNNEALIQAVESYIGFKFLNMIADNFEAFTKFINGIYTFELFYKTAEYADVLEVFDKVIPFDEVPSLDLEEKFFDDAAYVEGLIQNENVSLPDALDFDSQKERMEARQNLDGYEILVDDTVQEAAEVNYFINDKPRNMRYSDSQKKFMISNEFESAVNDLVSGLRKCDTTDDLLKYFQDANTIPKLVDRMSRTTIPYILVKVLTNPKKTPADLSAKLKKYTDSYASILSQNNGARRFENYDLFSTFKSDKEGTIKFIEDFCKLKLINDADASIANNTLLTIFNIFDSRIYLDLAYNVAPESITKEKMEDAFVKEIRGRINKNSRSKTAYTEEAPKETDETGTPTETKPDTTETVNEYVSTELKKFGTMTHNDMRYCDQFSALIEKEIDTIDDRMFNEHVSPILVDEYIGESYDVESLEAFYAEASVPQRRIRLQSAINSLMHDCEKIVSMDKQHRWNNNTFSRQYRTTTSMFLFFLCPNINGSSEEHTNIKQLHHWLGKAVNGKAGNFTSEQMSTLSQLRDLVSDMWGTVKLFWLNPRNWFKNINLTQNTGIQKRVRKMAEIAKQIVALKGELGFINDEMFVDEYAFMKQFSDEVIMEATTEENHNRLNKSVGLLMDDMGRIVKMSKENKWTNNSCLSMFRAGETLKNVKEAKKYVDRAIIGSGGVKVKDIDTLKELLIKIKDLLSTVNGMKLNPFIHKNIKESGPAKKVSVIANDIVKMKSSLGFLKDAPVKERPEDENKEKEEKTVEESTVMDFEEFMVVMEAAPEDGSIPNYMKNRIALSDNMKTQTVPVDLPDGVPQNPIPDLTQSIDTKLSTDSNDINDMLGSGYTPANKKEEAKTVINITNNYTNSFNKDSYNTSTTTDSSTGKVTNTTTTNTNSHNDSSSNKDSSNNKRTTSSNSVKTDKSGSNNNNNSSTSAELKESKKSETFSNGKTVQEMFAFLESAAPQSDRSDAGKPPKEDSLTKAMDRDRKTLPAQQGAKKATTKVLNTGKAVLKPVSRTKQWINNVVNSVIKRDEDQVKAEMFDNPSYRSAVLKAARLATKLGMTGVLTALSPYLGVGYVGVQGLKAMDKHRLKDEMANELMTELEITDQKIRDLSNSNSPEALKQKYELMRIRQKLIEKIPQTKRSLIKHPSDMA